MNLATYDIALIAGGFGIAGTLLGALINHILSFDRSRRDAKRFAGLKLREAFAPELARLQTQGSFSLPESSDLLERAFEKHHMAVNEFRFYLTGNELEAFTSVWEEYYKDPTGGDKPYFSQYMALSREDIQKAIDRITAILELTKDK
jgi:hypothetical protein